MSARTLLVRSSRDFPTDFMKLSINLFIPLWGWLAMAVLGSPMLASGYTNLNVAVYFRYQEVHSIPNDLARFSNQWANVEKQLKVDKVYLETTRNAQLANESEVTTLKKFFTDRGIKRSEERRV